MGLHPVCHMNGPMTKIFGSSKLVVSLGEKHEFLVAGQGILQSVDLAERDQFVLFAWTIRTGVLILRAAA